MLEPEETMAVRPTKKQKELLTFIETFIAEHGYSPSYREIMTSCNYTSVATVALHVNNLIKRGHLQKRDHAARSLEVVEAPKTQPLATNQIKAGDEKWLVDKIEHYFTQAEQNSSLPEAQLDQLYVLVGALKVLGLEGAAQSFVSRLSLLKKRYTKSS
jgi:SOS-response transcriptional repressor LexA